MGANISYNYSFEKAATTLKYGIEIRDMCLAECLAETHKHFPTII